MKTYRTNASLLGVLPICASVACSRTSEMSGATTTVHTTSTVDPSAYSDPTIATIEVEGTSLHVTRRGNGEPLLLIHGAGEDAEMLAAQAENLTSAGYEVITYDRRGTGRSGRQDWPGTGATQHADDLAVEIEMIVAAET
jgi:phosphoribulokinase